VPLRQEAGVLGEFADDPQQGIRGPVLEDRPAFPPDHGLRTHAEEAFEGVLAQAEALADLPDLAGETVLRCPMRISRG
jgi:hypothetical protein